jgi:hypothetical protein
MVFSKDYSFHDRCHAKSKDPQVFQGLSYRDCPMAIGVGFNDGQNFRRGSDRLPDLLKIPG